MKYISTRGHQEKQSSAEAMKRGIAPDGGLYVPETIPAVSMETIKSLLTMTYQERAKCLLSLFLTDFTKAALDTCVQGAYGEGKFDSDTPAPLVFLNDGCAVLELWHGPTSAFKDVALQILPRLMTETMRLTGEDREIVILVATSGDTGKAALDGFADVPGTKIIVFYPSDGVSAVQKQQMLTQTGANVHVVAVDGNFDDTQSGVKLIFSDAGIAAKMTRAGKVFSSANSINWGRLVPQIVYYFSAYADYCKSGRLTPGEAMNVVVPTGNFGNILAAWYAKTMGLPIAKFICASNDNNILTDFIHSGTYNKNRTFYKTVSPSMDILISSNLERLLYAFADGKATETAGYMKSLMQNGVYTVNGNVKKKLQEAFYGGWADQDATTDTIKKIWQENAYLSDTHTAVGFAVYDTYVKESGDKTPTVIVSTASPFKFTQSVAAAVLPADVLAGKDEFALLNALAAGTGWAVPNGLNGLADKPVLHRNRCAVEGMAKTVLALLDL